MISLHLTASGLDPHPLFARLLIASAELVLIVAFVHLLLAISRMRCPRVICFLWLAVLIKPLLSVTAGSLLPVPLFRASLLAAPVAESRSPAPPAAPSAPMIPSPAPAVERTPSPPGRLQADFPKHSLAPRKVPARQAGLVAPAGNPLPWVVLGIWLAGAGICLVRYVCALLRLRSLVRVAGPPDAGLDSEYRMLVRSLGIHAPPPLLISGQIESPALIGVLRPTILLPQWHVTNRSADQIRWSLRHELTHWRWRDSLSIFIRDIARIVFWFHPAVWWGGQRLTEALETACDHALVQSFRQAGQYAEYLFEILRAIRDRRRVGLAGGLFVTRTQIGRRIAALLDGSVTSAPGLTVRSLAGMVLLSGAILAVGATVRGPAGVPQPAVAAESLTPRIVQFPRNRSLGYCHFVNSDAVAGDLFTETFSTRAGGGDPAPVDARGTVTIPAGTILKLEVTPETFRVDHPFASLNPDDIQIITFESCPRPGSRELEVLSHLSGLIGLSLCGRNDLLKSDPPLDSSAIGCLAPLEQLQGLCLPSAVSADALEALGALSSLTALQIEAPQDPELPSATLTDEQLAAIGGLTSLTRLAIANGRPGVAAGLARLAPLRSLRSLRLIENTNPELNRHLQPISSLASLESLGFARSALNDEGLGHLRGLTRLRRLDLQGTSIGDQGLVHIIGLRELEELNLFRTRIGDVGLKYLEGLKTLRKLSLHETDITAAGLVSVSRLAALEELWIPNRAVTDAGFSQLGKLKSLRKMGSLVSSELTDVGLRSLPAMLALESLHIRAPRVTDASMPYIAQCGSLRELSLSASISDAGLAYLSGLQGLRELTLHNMALNGPGLGALGDLAELSELNLVRLTLGPGGLRNLRVPATVRYLRLNIQPGLADDDMAVLVGLANLRYLVLSVPGLTDRGLGYLAGLQNIESLSISGTDLQITDAGLKALEHLSALQSLFMRGTQVSEQGLREFREKLPGLVVSGFDASRTRLGVSAQSP